MLSSSLKSRESSEASSSFYLYDGDCPLEGQRGGQQQQQHHSRRNNSQQQQQQQGGVRRGSFRGSRMSSIGPSNSGSVELNLDPGSSQLHPQHQQQQQQQQQGGVRRNRSFELQVKETGRKCTYFHFSDHHHHLHVFFCSRPPFLSSSFGESEMDACGEETSPSSQPSLLCDIGVEVGLSPISKKSFLAMKYEGGFGEKIERQGVNFRISGWSEFLRSSVFVL